jgi:hypothetical protein
MGMGRTAALASTRASAEAPRASISHPTHTDTALDLHITVPLPQEQPKDPFVSSVVPKIVHCMYDSYRLITEITEYYFISVLP